MNKILLIIGTFLMNNNFLAITEKAKKNAPHVLKIEYVDRDKLNTLKWKHNNHVDISKRYIVDADDSNDVDSTAYLIKTTFVIHDIEYVLKCDLVTKEGILYCNDQEISRGSFTIQEDPNTAVVPILNVEGAQSNTC